MRAFATIRTHLALAAAGAAVATPGFAASLSVTQTFEYAVPTIPGGLSLEPLRFGDSFNYSGGDGTFWFGPEDSSSITIIKGSITHIDYFFRAVGYCNCFEKYTYDQAASDRPAFGIPSHHASLINSYGGAASRDSAYYSLNIPLVKVDGEVFSVTSVPEAATWTLMVIGFGAVGHATRRRRQRVIATKMASSFA